jgi:putative nucleotidyltransferase with HDIG domain
MECMSVGSRSRPYWLEIYVWGIVGLGLVLFVLSIGRLASDWIGIGALTLLAGISELSSVELFNSSRNSRVSVSSIVALAGIMIYGPFAGILVHGFSGLITMVPNTFLTKLPRQGRESTLKRGFFNMGMFVVSTFAAGLTYLSLGGNFNRIISASNFVPLVGAALVDTLANVCILIGVLTLQTGKSPAEIWKQNFQWSVPISILGGIIGGGALAVAYDLAGLLGVVIFFLPVLSIGYSFRLYANNSRKFIDQLEQLNLKLTRSNQQLEATNQELMETLASVVDAYDKYTYGHSAYVSVWAGALARELELEPDKIKALEQAGLLHDIGKVGISDAIINKPGPLTEDEYAIVKKHPTIGAEIVGRMSGLQPLVPFILHHHERWDGKGYPSGLAGEAIPLEARILALADAVDTMCSNRPYRPARNPEYVLQEVQKSAGTQFDPKVVKAFERFIDREGPEFLKKSRISDDRSSKVGRIERLRFQSQLKNAFSPPAGQSPSVRS